MPDLKKIFSSTQAREMMRACSLAAAAFVIALACKLAVPNAIYGYERLALVLLPSAERAYEYGNRHFASTKPYAYDIDRAEYFYRRAYAEDPVLPYVNHQLARIAFLRGDFTNALQLIDTELAENPSPASSSFYVRGLILGFMQRYAEAGKAYEQYLKSDPTNWAALNDYAWVLLRAGRFEEAREVAGRGLRHAPDNPWLLNTMTIALSEIGETEAALQLAQASLYAFDQISERDWLVAYPGNDPRIAEAGLETFRMAILENMHMLEEKYAAGTVQ